ncbi:hypothetical protein F4801DRAFT_67456 [Xylaria longipes]|nr:hypothetical protein F4801DRAFT_67456 [Xylaria longipes]
MRRQGTARQLATCSLIRLLAGCWARGLWQGVPASARPPISFPLSSPLLNPFSSFTIAIVAACRRRFVSVFHSFWLLSRPLTILSLLPSVGSHSFTGFNFTL